MFEFDAKSDPYFSMCSREELLEEINAWHNKYESQISKEVTKRYEDETRYRRETLDTKEKRITVEQENLEKALSNTFDYFMNKIDRYTSYVNEKYDVYRSYIRTHTHNPYDIKWYFEKLIGKQGEEELNLLIEHLDTLEYHIKKVDRAIEATNKFKKEHDIKSLKEFIKEEDEKITDKT